VAHTCNPSYSGGLWLKSAWENSLRDPISKIPNTKRAGGVAQGVGPEFKPRYHTHTKRMFGNAHKYSCLKKKCFSLIKITQSIIRNDYSFPFFFVMEEQETQMKINVIQFFNNQLIGPF
jgi:hypothetical protein